MVVLSGKCVCSSGSEQWFLMVFAYHSGVDRIWSSKIIAKLITIKHTHTQERRQFMNILDPVLNQGFRLRGIDIAGKRLDRI